jgi:hypothetical protein
MLCACRLLREGASSRGNGIVRSYRQSIMRDVRNVAEKAAGRTAPGGAGGSTLVAGKNRLQIAFLAISICGLKTCGEKFNIDANFATDIIPRGWEVRQARQTRLSVSNKQVQSFRKAAAVRRGKPGKEGFKD